MAQIAMVRRELVDEEKWIPSSHFNRLLAVYQVLPGPEAHELCVHMGMLRGGRLGGLLAGLGFMLPGLVLMLALSWLYFQINLTDPLISSAFLGVQVAVIALIVRAVHRIGTHVLLNPTLWLIGILTAAASAAGASFLLVLPIAGAVHAVVARYNYRLREPVIAATLLTVTLVTTVSVVLALSGQPLASVPTSAQAASTPSLVDLFLSGLKAGLLTFGGAYTVIPFLRNDAVGRGWLTDGQFLDGLALSGILPAPLIIFSTFVGYVAAGPLGAVVMTAAIFLPAFAFSLLLRDRLESLVENDALHTFLEGVAAGVVGLIAVTTLQLGAGVSAAVPALLPTLVIFGVALAVLFVSKAKTTVIWVVAGAGVAGLVAFRPLG